MHLGGDVSTFLKLLGCCPQTPFYKKYNMSRCRCCDVMLVGHVRFKSEEEFEGLFVEEDMCNTCIFISDNSEYIDTKTYQFEDITESLFNSLNVQDLY